MHNKMFRRFVVSLSLTGLLMCQVAQAAAPTVRDVALPMSQVMSGQLVDSEGAAQAGTDVALIKDGVVVAAVRTDSEGRFTISNVQPGLYQVQSADAVGVYRVWAPRTAPPAAQQGVLLVTDGEVVRQQSQFLGALGNPWILGAIVAAAIAIPLAVSNDDDDAS